MREIVSLSCSECKRRNNSTTKNRKKSSERLAVNKFCRFCRKHTGQKESK
jgi:large subunit ribosomal protein L33